MTYISWPSLGRTRLLVMLGVALLIGNNELVQIRIGQAESVSANRTANRAVGQDTRETVVDGSNQLTRNADQQTQPHQQHHQVLKFVPHPDLYLSAVSTLKQKPSENVVDSHRAETSTASGRSKTEGCCLSANLDISRSRIEIGMTAIEVTRAPTEEARMIIKQHGSHYQQKLETSELKNLVRLEKSFLTAEALRSSTSVGQQLGHLTGRRIARSPSAIGRPFAIQAVVGQRLSIPCPVDSAVAQGTSAELARSSGRPARPADGQSLKRQPGFNQSRPMANGQGISLIVWHKDDQLDSPIFSIDARGVGSLREAKQQTDSESLKGRAHFEESARLDGRGFGALPALVIDEASLQDGGVYTCTVEFHKEPTQMHQIRVTLIIPPRNMLIFEETSAGQNNISHHLSSGAAAAAFGQHLAGPYDEDTAITLTCEAEFEDRSLAASQIGWWRLSSISVLPANGLLGPLPSSAKDSTRRVDFLSAEYMTTVSQAHHSNEEEAGGRSSSTRDYFVGLHSNPHEQNLIIPFSGGQRQLRHWTRVRADRQQSPQTDRLRASIQLTLARSHLDNELLCLATNNDFSAPLNLSVRINLNLKPTEVRIVRKQNYLFKLGQKLVVECQVHGSKPSAMVRWFRGSQELETGAFQNKRLDEDSATQNYISEFNRDIDNNLTKISYLTLIPRLSDNQKSLVCSAHNPQMSNLEPLSDSVIMNVQFAAQLSLQYGANIKQDSIKLGSDIFMECNIQANPPINELTWLLNEEPLTANVSNGIIISNQSLVLQRIRVESRGQYQCATRNSMGLSRSNKLELRPRFEPVCDYARTKTRYEVTINQSIKIECYVMAEPADDLSFVWKFNQTLGGESAIAFHTEDVKQFETNFTQSQVTFTPKSKRHYGQFLCSASNSMGKQERACVIQVVQSELPEPVFGCFFDNLSNDSFSVHCQTPQSASSRQNYLLELYTSDVPNNAELIPFVTPGEPSLTHLKQRQEESQQDLPQDEEQLANGESRQQQVKKVSSDSPSFHLTDLKPDTSYKLMIYVINPKGRSQPAFYQTSTLPVGVDLGQEAQSSGRLQFINKRPAEAALGFTEKFNSYLKSSGDYLTTFKQLKPLTSIILIVLLCLIVFAILGLFVARICRLRTNTTSSGGGRKRRHTGRSSTIAPAAERITAEKLSIYERREPLLDRTVQLTPASKARLQGLAGNGSDTSRETNTDSTLISNGATGQLVLLDNNSKSKQHSGPMTLAIEPYYKRTRSAEQEGSCESGLLSSMPMLMLAQQGGTLKGKAEDRTGRHMQGLYSQVVKRANHSAASPLNTHELSSTPQVSIQSGSDCTSNNELQADHSELHDQLLVKCNHGNINEPVYVIGRNKLHNGADQSHQLHLLNPSDLWPYGESTYGHNCASVGTGDSLGEQRTFTADSASENVCQLIGDMRGRDNELPVPVGFIPNSLSIPVSLSDCLHFGANNQQNRQLSQQDFLTTTGRRRTLCIANTNGSYLALAPDSGEISYTGPTYSPYCDRPT